MIIFETNRSGPVETWIMNADGSDQRRLFPFPYGAGRLPWQPVVSAFPRAATQQIVFMQPVGHPLVPSPGAIYEIAMLNLDGSGFRQLTNDGKFKFLPHFSPDGAKIVYTKYSAGQYGSPDAVYDIAVYDLASGTETVITHDGHAQWATWSPDGSRIAYLTQLQGGTLWTIAPDGSNPQKVASPSGAMDDLQWGDPAWSRDNWILFVVLQNVNGCQKARTDRIRPDGTSRTQVTDGGPNCSPPSAGPSGDADPGWSRDGKTIYSSRGFPVPAANGPPASTERKLYAFSSEAWYPGKPEIDLSLPSEPSCIEGVPKGSPDGRQVLLFRLCLDNPINRPGIYIADATGSYRTFITEGFGADWNPTPFRRGRPHRD
jgi:Tol biopolymer transport system component